MKTSVITPEFQAALLKQSNDPNAFEGRASCSKAPEDYHHRIDDPLARH